ncbi:uncharacterized protein LOC131144077 [Malania oleifera]|uniref:uncharacterized protein LOC131144077 n=1 Tax=Malania oleifera TaxID=397392 RepID=UPI0025AE2391|nr:uncharacterized protein LOC131144077 [Malania oleifera]
MEHKMSGADIENAKEPDLVDNTLRDQVDDKHIIEDPKHSAENDENPFPSPQQEEEAIKKKYGGILPKKTPLISKDHERAFFDSADWALGKQGVQKPKGPLEALRPKLQPTPQQQMRSRRSAYAPAGDVEDGGNNGDPSPEDQGCVLDPNNDSNSTTPPEEPNRQE